jgi:hypothetical protein
MPSGRISAAVRVVDVSLWAFGSALLVWAWRADRAWFEAHIFSRFCATDSAELSRAVLQRALGVILGLLVLFVARPYAGRWLAQRASFDLASIARTLLATLLALVASDLILRLPLFRRARPGPLTFVTRDPHYGWRNTAPLSTVEKYGDREIRYVIAADGNRVRAAEEPIDPARPTILFAGESITFGFGVTYDESYPAIVGQALGVQPANISVTAHSNDQAYLRAHDELARFAHPRHRRGARALSAGGGWRDHRRRAVLGVHHGVAAPGHGPVHRARPVPRGAPFDRSDGA